MKIYKKEVSQSDMDTIIRALETCEELVAKQGFSYMSGASHDSWVKDNQDKLVLFQMVHYLRRELGHKYQWSYEREVSAD